MIPFVLSLSTLFVLDAKAEEPAVIAPSLESPAPVSAALAFPSLPGPEAASDAAWLALYDQSVILLDDRRSDDDRVAAAETLFKNADSRALPFLRAAAHDATARVQSAAVTAAVGFRSAEGYDVARLLLAHPVREREVWETAIAALAEVSRPEAGELLWTLTGDSSVKEYVRSRSMRALEDRYPDLLAQRGTPSNVSDRLGGAVGVAANGLLGGQLLGSVGSWGQFGGGAAIGASGGALIGLGTGALYAVRHPVTRGQGFAYASGVAWGLAAGSLGSKVAFGSSGYGEDATIQQRRDRFGPALRSVGTAAGAVFAVRQFRRGPSAADVLETDLAGYLASGLFTAGADLLMGPRPEAPMAVDPLLSSSDSIDTTDFDNELFQRSRVRSAATLGGAAVGLGAGMLLSKSWKLDRDDAIFASVIGVEAAWAGAYGAPALGIDENLEGTLRLPLHAAVAGALAYTEFHPVSRRQSATGAFGMVAGNTLGASLPLLAGYEDGESVARSMVPTGIFGTALGIRLAPWLATSNADWTMVAVGTPIAVAQSAAIGAFLSERGHLSPSQVGGLALATSGGIGTGLLTLGHYLEPNVENSVFIGSAAVWGAWFGMITPAALDINLSGSEYGLSGALVSDAFMLGGGALVQKGLLRPGRTLVPQLGGLSGATVGALGAAMFSRDGQDVAMGALIGSTAGMAGGAILAHKLGAKAEDLALHLPGVRLPGTWVPSASPMVGADGKTGLRLGLTGTGW